MGDQLLRRTSARRAADWRLNGRSMASNSGASISNAFAPWALPALDSLPCMPAATVAPLPQLTAGLAALVASCSRTAASAHAAGGVATGGAPAGLLDGMGTAMQTAPPPAAATAAAATAEPPGGGWTLPDGRLRVGTHLPLLARRYRYLGPVGEGASAQVVLAQDELRRGSPPVVLKVMRRHLAAAGQKEARALRFLSAAAPPAAAAGIVSLRGAFHFKGHYVLVLERLHGSLLDHIVSMAGAPARARVAALRKLAQQLLTALAGLHACGIAHADLKPDNVLMTRPVGGAGVGVKLADFGSCFAAAGVDTARLSFELQTLSYRAPEASAASLQLCTHHKTRLRTLAAARRTHLTCSQAHDPPGWCMGSRLDGTEPRVADGSGPVGPPADMWSLGCVLAEAALQRPLFPAHSPAKLLQQISAALRPADGSKPRAQPAALPAAAYAEAAPWAVSAAGLTPRCGELRGWHLAAPPLLRELATLDRSLADLVSKLLVVEPQHRLSAQVALQHNFLLPAVPPAALPHPVVGAPPPMSAAAGAAAGQAAAQQGLTPLPRPAPWRGGAAAPRAAAAAGPWAAKPKGSAPAAAGSCAAAAAAASGTPAAGAANQGRVLPPQHLPEASASPAAMAAPPAVKLQPGFYDPGAAPGAPAVACKPAAASQPPETSGCTSAADGGSSLPLGGSTAGPQSAWQRLGPLIDEMLPTDDSLQGGRTLQAHKLPGHRDWAAGSADQEGALPPSTLHAGSTAPRALGSPAAMSSLQRSLADGGNGGSDKRGSSDDSDGDGTTTAAHSAAVAALAALASSVPLLPKQQRQQQQRWEQRQQEAPATGGRKGRRLTAAGVATPRSHAAARPERNAAKRQRLSHLSDGRSHPGADTFVGGASPAKSGRGTKRRMPSAVEADDSATATPNSRDTPQRSLRDRQSAGSRKPWWQV